LYIFALSVEILPQCALRYARLTRCTPNYEIACTRLKPVLYCIRHCTLRSLPLSDSALLGLAVDPLGKTVRKVRGRPPDIFEMNRWWKESAAARSTLGHGASNRHHPARCVTRGRLIVYSDV
jgi:hypothetical protein